MLFIQIILFLTLAIGLLLGAHYFFYFSLVKFFSITSGNIKLVLLIILAFLAVSFILASLLIFWREHFFTRAFYFLSGLWLGLLVNLLLALIGIWLILGLASLVGININKIPLAIIFFVLAFGYLVYGIWNATNIQTKNISVDIPNLPKNWQGKKIVQITDVHLGVINQRSFIEKIIHQINAVNPEAVMITGDYFDGMDGSLDSLALSLTDLDAPAGVYFVTGNHETYLGAEKVFSALEKTPVKVLNDKVVDVQGLKIIGLSFSERNEQKDIILSLEKLKNEYLGQPNILLYHSPTNISQVATQGINLELTGHTHHGQIFPFGYITNLIFHGYDYGLFKISNYTLYASCGVGTWGPAMRTGSKPEIVVITLN